MGSYLSKKEDKPISNNGIFSHANITWLKKQLWAWILLGIFIMSVFFYIAKGLIVFIGGTALGIYLYNIYGKDNKGDNNKPPNIKGINDNILNNTMGYVRSGVSTINNTINPPKIEGFNTGNNRGSYNLFSNLWWKTSR